MVKKMPVKENWRTRHEFLVCMCVCVCVRACVRACEWRRGQISALFQNFHAEWQLIMTPAQIKKMYTTFHPSTQFYLNPLFTQN